MTNAEKLNRVLETRNVYTYSWEKFNSFDINLQTGVEEFWERGYDYTDPEFWTCYPNTEENFITALLMYDWLMTDGGDSE